MTSDTGPTDRPDTPGTPDTPTTPDTQDPHDTQDRDTQDLRDVQDDVRDDIPEKVRDDVPAGDEQPTVPIDPAAHAAAGDTATAGMPGGSGDAGAAGGAGGSGDAGAAGGPDLGGPGAAGTGAAEPGAGGGGGWFAGGFAGRYRLVRPRGGTGQRKVVGVCAALGQATNTDPVLWRVLIAILSFFGGIGVLIYALGWLVIPQEGDQASPVEALFGRGRSSTSPIVTVLLCILAAVLVFTSLRSSFWSPVLLAGTAVGVAVLLGRRGGRAPAGGAAGPGAGTGGTAGGPGGPGGWQQAGYSVPPTGASNPAYRAPFAPHGPYGQNRPYPPAGAAYQDTKEYPLAGREPDPWAATPGGRPLPPPPPPPPPTPPVTTQPRPPKQRSPLGRYTFFALCLALGGLAVLAVTGAGVSPSAYVALGLAVVGAGLLVGAFLGRARGLIALGIILAMAMPPALIGETVRWDHVRSDIARNRNFDNQTWRPVSFDSVQPSYRSDLGNATLDLTQVDFTGQDGTIDVSAGAGNVKVLLPSTVDTTVTVQNGMGNVTLFGDQQPHGFRNGDESVTNLGSDGTGGGTLNLSINAGMGNVEVVRS